MDEAAVPMDTASTLLGSSLDRWHAGAGLTVGAPTGNKHLARGQAGSGRLCGVERSRSCRSVAVRCQRWLPSHASAMSCSARKPGWSIASTTARACSLSCAAMLPCGG